MKGNSRYFEMEDGEGLNVANILTGGKMRVVNVLVAYPRRVGSCNYIGSVALDKTCFTASCNRPVIISGHAFRSDFCCKACESSLGNLHEDNCWVVSDE